MRVAHCAQSILLTTIVRMRAAGAFGGPQVDTAKIEAFFDAYKEADGDVVRPAALMLAWRRFAVVPQQF